MAIGGRRRGGRRAASSGAPRTRVTDRTSGDRAVRRRAFALGALAAAAVAVVLALAVVGAADAADGGGSDADRAEVADEVTAAVETALEPLGLRAAPDLLAAPAAFADALDAASDDTGVVRAAAAGEALLGLLASAREGIAAIDVPGSVRGRGLDAGFVVDLIQARQRMLDALDLYAAAARLAGEAAVIEEPSLTPILATSRDLVAQAAATFLEGHDLLVEAQVAAGTYGGPLVPGAGVLGAVRP